MNTEIKQKFLIDYQKDNPMNINGIATQGLFSKEEFVILVKELNTDFFDLFHECRYYDEGITLVSSEHGLEKIKKLIV